jgi:ATP-binding cassette subfamily A (ABC1) protein 3
VHVWSRPSLAARPVADPHLRSGGANYRLHNSCTWAPADSLPFPLTFHQFLDEADLLGDQIAVLAAPGKLVAQGTPVALKSTLGEGYALRISFAPTLQQHERAQVSATLLERLRGVAPSTTTAAGETSSETVFHLKTKDASVVRSALVIVDETDFSASIASYHVQGASIEGIFLDLMAAESGTPEEEKSAELEKVHGEELKSPGEDPATDVPQLAHALNLTDGRSKSPLVQTLTIFHKRMLIVRRSWLTPLIAILVAICGACIPLVFLTDREQSCVRRFVPSYAEPLYLPFSPITFSVQDPNPNVTTPVDPSSQVYVSPPGVLHSLGPSVQNLSTADVSDNATFLNTIKSNYRNLMLGGVSFDFAHNASLFAWEASAPGDTGPTMLTLISNVLYNRAINASGAATVPHLITPYYEAFPPVAAGTLVALKWVAFFGAALAVVSTSFVPGHSQHRLIHCSSIPRSSRYTFPRSAARVSRQCNSPMASPIRRAYGLATSCLMRCSLYSL